MEEFDLQSYLDTALRLFPKVRHVFVVSDASASNQVHLRALRNIARRRTPLHFEFLDGSLLSFGQILEQLRALPPDSMVMTTSFTHDSSGLYVPLADAGAQIVRAAGRRLCSVRTARNWARGLRGLRQQRPRAWPAGRQSREAGAGRRGARGMSLVRHGVLQMVLDYAVLERHGVAPG